MTDSNHRPYRVAPADSSRGHYQNVHETKNNLVLQGCSVKDNPLCQHICMHMIYPLFVSEMSKKFTCVKPQSDSRERQVVSESNLGAVIHGIGMRRFAHEVPNGIL